MQEEESYHPIRKYLRNGEGETVEYKQTINSEYKIAKTICSLANTSGGTLLVGVKDDRSILGVDPEEEKYFITKAAEFHCRPPVPIEIEEIFLPDEENHLEEVVVLKVEVPESNQKPHYAESKKGKWTSYIRKDDQTLIAGPQAVAQLERSEPKPLGNVSLTRNEKRLLAYLEKNIKITAKQFTNLVNISDRRARRELQEALDKGIIRVLEHEKEDYYVI